jgi:Spy/CpxP family protein refolding chaperone
MRPHTKHKALLVAGVMLGAALALTVPSHAGSTPGKGPGGPGGHHFMMGGGGPIDMVLGQALEQAKLTTAQKATLDGIRAKADQLHEDARSKFESAHTDISTELAKPEPDLRALSTRLEATHDQMRKTMEEVRNGYLSLYDQLAADQKKEVAAALRTHMEEMKKRHQEWRHGGPQDSSPTDEPAG